MIIPTSLKYALKSLANVHKQGPEQNIFLFATARGGSTWVMELIASQPGIKYYDEPFNIRRDNVSRTGVIPNWKALMPETCDAEKIVRYLKDLEQNRFRHMNPPPFRRNHRLLTNRIVFKIHELQHMIGTIAKRCEGTVVYLLRHPVPTTLSRKVFPRLDLLVKSTYYRELIGDRHKLDEMDRLVSTGTHLQRGMVSWCLENLVPLRFADFSGLFITYEELVLNPVKSCDLLMKHLHLTDREAMLRAFGQPAANISMSSKETQTVMNDPDERRRKGRLITKWKAQISPQDKADVSAILELFCLDVYDGYRFVSNPKYLHFDDSETMLHGVDGYDSEDM